MLPLVQGPALPLSSHGDLILQIHNLLFTAHRLKPSMIGSWGFDAKEGPSCLDAPLLGSEHRHSHLAADAQQPQEANVLDRALHGSQVSKLSWPMVSLSPTRPD
jgi:hypothetical protein